MLPFHKSFINVQFIDIASETDRRLYGWNYAEIRERSLTKLFITPRDDLILRRGQQFAIHTPDQSYTIHTKQQSCLSA